MEISRIALYGCLFPMTGGSEVARSVFLLSSSLTVTSPSPKSFSNVRKNKVYLWLQLFEAKLLISQLV